jgi:hypothetical protein
MSPFDLDHADALIELLSVVDGDLVLRLGLTAAQAEALEEVFETSCEFYETTVGRPHPLANPSPQDDAETPDVIVIHDNPGSVN